MTSNSEQNVLEDFFTCTSVCEVRLIKSNAEYSIINNNNLPLGFNTSDNNNNRKGTYGIFRQGNKENFAMDIYKPIIPDEIQFGNFQSDCNFFDSTGNDCDLHLSDVNMFGVHFSASPNSTNSSISDASINSNQLGIKRGTSSRTVGLTESHRRKRTSIERQEHNSSISKRAYTLSAKLRARFKFFKIRRPTIVNPIYFDQCNSLNQGIWEIYNNNAQTFSLYNGKVKLWREMFIFMSRLFESYSLYMVGSTMTGFGTNNSDVDMCFLIKPANKDIWIDSLYRLNDIKNLLLQSDLIKEAELINARVPILKFKSYVDDLEVDLNCNTSIGIYNTHMLLHYAQLDWRVRPLVIFIKIWAQKNAINDAKNMSVSSYSWTLMVIHYLQYAVNPPILPSLQMLYPNLFNMSMPPVMLRDTFYRTCNFRTQNTRCLAELLLGFFEYFSVFDYCQNAVSVRVGGIIPVEQCRQNKSPKNDPFQWKYLSIEEPFDHTNTARSVYDAQAFKRIKNVIGSSYGQLLKTHCLDSILPVDPSLISNFSADN